MSSNFPLLETPRLVLKELNPTNLKILFTQKDDRYLYDFFSCRNAAELKELILRYWKSFTDNARFSHKYWLILDKDSELVIGDCGFHVWHIRHARAEIGYAIKEESFKKKGIMTEALERVIPFAFEEMKLQKIEAFVSPGNTPSLRIMQNFGFVQEGVLKKDYHWKGEIYDSIAFGLLKMDFEQRRNKAKNSLGFLVQSFENRTLPKADWTHEAHLSVALWYLKNYNQATALCKLRAGIITYNTSVGTKNTASMGYHETLTLFWVKALTSFLQKYGEGKNVAECRQLLLSSPYADKKLPLRFYSKAKLMSVEARGAWVEPDLQLLNLQSLEKP